MAKNKDKKIIEEEPVVYKAPEVIVENLKKLVCKKSFTDKFDNSIVYKIGDELNITDVVRRKDLIERGLAVEE